jgi:ankyrin repeat protein
MFPSRSRVNVVPIDTRQPPQSGEPLKEFVSIVDIMKRYPPPEKPARKSSPKDSSSSASKTSSSFAEMTRSFADMSARSYYKKTPISHDGFSPLHYNSATGRLLRVREGLISGANINSRDQDGATPLHLACFYGKLPVIRQLLMSKADLTIRDFKGFTALHSACMCGHPGCVRSLLVAGADTHVRDNEGRTPINIARNHKHYPVVNLLMAKEFNH